MVCLLQKYSWFDFGVTADYHYPFCTLKRMDRINLFTHDGSSLCDSRAVNYSTHWDWVTHICVSKLTIIGLDYGLSPGRRHVNVWTNAGILFNGPLGKNFSENVFLNVLKPYVDTLWCDIFGS